MSDSTDARATYLLLLPLPPQPASAASLKAAYGPAIEAVLEQLAFKHRHSTLGSILDIALPCPHLVSTEGAPRSATYAATQHLLAGVYKLICVLAAEKSVNVEDAEGVDVRILLLAQSREIDAASPLDLGKEPSAQVIGPIINVNTLAKSERPWDVVYAAEGEQCESLLRRFLVTADRHVNIYRVPGGIVQVQEGQSLTGRDEGDSSSKNVYHSVAVGGTFDHLHIGHKLLLTMFAFLLQLRSDSADSPACYTIGITGDALLKNKKYAEMLESWEDRERATAAFLLALLDFRPPKEQTRDVKHVNEEAGKAVYINLTSDLVIRLVEIQDPFGPTITAEKIEALAISAETRAGGDAVNKKRDEQGWKKLDVFEVDVLDPTDANEDGEETEADTTFQSKISSTQIRQKLHERGQQRRDA